LFFLHITAAANLSDEDPDTIFGTTISERAIVFTGKNDIINIRVFANLFFMIEQSTIKTHFCSFTHFFLSVINTTFIVWKIRLTWTQASNMSPSGALSISTWSIPVIGRQVFTCSIRSDGRRLIGVPLIVADFLRRCSTFTFAFELLAPIRARCTETDSDGGFLAIAIDRLLVGLPTVKRS